MMKKLLCFAVAMMLMGCCAGAFGEGAGESAAPLTSAELAEGAQAMKEQAAAGEVLNDPADPAAETEDGNLFQYAFGTMYADGTEITGDTPVNAIEMGEEGTDMPRGLSISMTPWDVSALFPNDNPEMAGDREGALLYLQESEENSLVYGRVYRDGQRISILEYGEILPDGDGYRAAVLSCLFAEGLLYRVRMEGFEENQAVVMSKEDRDGLAAELKALGRKDEYRAVKMSRDGLELTEFAAEDLMFSGLDLRSLQPEGLPEPYVTDLFDNEDGTWILTVTGEEYEAVFQCEAEGKNPKIVSFTITGDEMEGPRGVRLGDMFHEDLQRFRYESRGLDDTGTGEVLYGDGAQGARGTASYTGVDGMSLQYTAPLADGREATLLLRYNFNMLTEILIFIN